MAILAIMAFHSGLPGIDVGGFFSQDAFFVLSGMVITLILLQEWNRTGAIRLGRFYAGRIRRLLPGPPAHAHLRDALRELRGATGPVPGVPG